MLKSHLMVINYAKNNMLKKKNYSKYIKDKYK